MCDQSGSGNEKSVGIEWNRSRHESHQITLFNSNTTKHFKIRLLDAVFICGHSLNVKGYFQLKSISSVGQVAACHLFDAC